MELPTFKSGLPPDSASVAGGALGFGEFRLTFWNKLVRRVDLKPYKSAEAEHKRHQEKRKL
jgi:hypothetical protein